MKLKNKIALITGRVSCNGKVWSTKIVQKHIVVKAAA